MTSEEDYLLAPTNPFKRPGIDRAVLWLAGFGLLVIVALFAFLIGRDREDLAAEETSRAEINALLLSEHAGRLFESAELALSTVVDDTRGMDLSHLRDGARLHRRLLRLAGRLPYVEAFWLHDASGKLRLTSLTHPPPAADASEAEFFVVHREATSSSVHVGELISGGTNRPVFRLSRRIENDQGDFRGVASLSVEAPFFREVYGRVPLPEGSSITLVRAPDLVPLVQQPQSTPRPILHNTSKFRDAITEHPDQGLFRSSSFPDHEERVFAYRKVSGFPLYVKVSVPLSGVRDAWIDRVILRLAEAALAVVVLGLLTLLALREAGRQHLFQQTLEQRVTSRTADLARAVQEVHHRVRNNLQIVGTLLTMQASRVREADVREALSESIGRVHTLSLAHQTMYSAGAVTELPFGTYLRDLANQVGDLYPAPIPAIRVTGSNPNLPLETAVPLGLIVHEALTNALKHAFPEGRPGLVEISYTQDECGWRLSIADDGRGLPDGHAEGLGMRIMRSLAMQVGAEAHLTSSAAGTRVTVAGTDQVCT